MLIGHFLEEFCGPSGGDIDEEAMSILMQYNYPGNIRELKSIVRSAVNLAGGKTITANCLPKQVVKKTATVLQPRQQRSKPIHTLAELEKAHILEVYQLMKNNKAKTARVLDIGVNTLRRKLQAYGVQ